MKAFIDSSDGRKTSFFEHITPHMSNLIEIDGIVGVHKFTLTKLTNPTMEFLDTLNLGKGHFQTMYDVYQFPDLQFTPDFGKYQIMFENTTGFRDYKSYCDLKGAKYFFIDDSLFFVVPKGEIFLTSGTLLISSGNDVVRFTTTKEADSIHLYSNLYLNTALKNIEVFSDKKPIDQYEICHGVFEDDEAKFKNGIARGVVIKAPTNGILSSIGIIVYERAGVTGFEFREINYASWNQKTAVLNLNHLEDEIGAGTTITKLFILYDINTAEKTTVDKLFPGIIDIASKKSALHFVKNENASLVPMIQDDPRLYMNFGADNEYFANIKSISKRLALDLISEEYSKVRNILEIPKDETLTTWVFYVPNRYSQVISLYVNGLFYHHEFLREDRLGLSKIILEKEHLKEYGEIKTLEACVEPLFTRRYDLVIDDDIQYGKAAMHAQSDELNLIPLYDTAGLDNEFDLFVDGHYIRKEFYEFVNYNNNLFIFLKKRFPKNSYVSCIVHADDIYDVKKGTISDIEGAEHMSRYNKIYYAGKLIPYNHIHDFLEGKYYDIALDTLPDINDAKIEILEYKNNKMYDFIADGNDENLLKGFHKISEVEKKVAIFPMVDIYSYIKTQVSSNIILANNYPIHNHEDDIIKRTKFVYDCITIGKKLRGIVSGNDIIDTGVKNYITTTYQDLINSNGVLVLSNNETVISQAPMPVIFERYDD